jgi:hypothetical protein
VAALVSAKDVEAVVRAKLVHEGYRVSTERAHGETGTDVIGTRGIESIHLEAIAFKSSPPARSKDFYEAFFRAVSRLELGATTCVIALPSRFGMGFPQRAKASGAAWRRMGIAFPELEVWLVDTSELTVRRTSWLSWSDPLSA